MSLSRIALRPTHHVLVLVVRTAQTLEDTEMWKSIFFFLPLSVDWGPVACHWRPHGSSVPPPATAAPDIPPACLSSQCGLLPTHPPLGSPPPSVKAVELELAVYLCTFSFLSTRTRTLTPSHTVKPTQPALPPSSNPLLGFPARNLWPPVSLLSQKSAPCPAAPSWLGFLRAPEKVFQPKPGALLSDRGLLARCCPPPYR